MAKFVPQTVSIWQRFWLQITAKFEPQTVSILADILAPKVRRNMRSNKQRFWSELAKVMALNDGKTFEPQTASIWQRLKPQMTARFE